MKNMRKLATLLLALVMLFTLAVSASADEPDAPQHKITLTFKTSAHTYTAYQVFKGDISDGKLTNIAWGAGVNGDTLLTALRSDSTLGTDFDKKVEGTEEYQITTAEQVADVLATYQNDSDKLEAFARLVNSNLTSTAAGSSGTATADGDKYKYEITVTGDGYYFVKDTGSIEDNDAATKYILQVLNDVTIAAKADIPTLDKKIIENNQPVDANGKSIGDKVDYKLTSKIPDMDGYNNYFFVVNDTMEPGLTFNEDVAIQIGQTTLASDKYTVTKGSDTEDNTTIKIVIKNFIDYANQKGAEIAITYSATINEDAKIGETGNKNKANLVYSNNPNVDTDGDEPDDDDGDVTGKTPDAEVITYVSGIQLKKTDGSEALAGAKFKIEGTSLKVVVINEKMFKKADDGTYYRLKDGTYTEEVATEVTKDKYESTVTKYTEVTEVTTTTIPTEIEAEAWVDTNGIIKFKGLGAGTYKITELIAPDGYNKIDEPIEIVISFNAEGDTKWSATKGGTALTANTASLFEFDVINRAGSTLPSTGGVGTTLFYVIGSVLVLAAVVLLVTKKRMSSVQ